ncbi:plasmid pRiA4b ORF-3 family protein [Sinorhizobium fredii]|nr:plasmid pRiA4b ORF-3 family protein [Sinorhizobium fredii]
MWRRVEVPLTTSLKGLHDVSSPHARSP